MFTYQSRFLRRGEVWFDNQPNGKRVDWIFYRNRSSPVPGARSRNFYNRLIDLSKTPEALLADMDPKTVVKIQKAAADDKLTCEWRLITNPGQIEEIELMWNQSIESKRRWGKLDRDWLAQMIAACAFEREQIVTLKGWVLVTAARLIDRAKELRQKKTEFLDVRPDEATA